MRKGGLNFSLLYLKAGVQEAIVCMICAQIVLLLQNLISLNKWLYTSLDTFSAVFLKFQGCIYFAEFVACMM